MKREALIEYKIITPDGKLQNVKLNGYEEDGKIVINDPIPEGDIMVNTDKTTICELEVEDT